MIRVDVCCVRIPTSEGLAIENLIGPEAYLSPERIDTVTPVTGAAHAQLLATMPDVRAIVRYFDPLKGFRLFFVKQSAAEVARMRRREMQGEDSGTPDFNNPFA